MSMHLKRYRGDTYKHLLVIQDSNGNPIDITGYSFILTINKERDPTDGSNIVLTMTGVIEDAAEGKVALQPALNDINAADIGSWYFDIQQTDGAGDIRTLVKGRYDILQDISK